MCASSFVGDNYNHTKPWVNPGIQTYPTVPFQMLPATPVAQQSLEELLEFVRILKIAHEYDIANNEPDCPSPEKIKVFRTALTNLNDQLKTIAFGPVVNYKRLATALEAAEQLEQIIGELNGNSKGTT